ncbi:hypothetical protein OV203_18795 [Nannocystis sp. ILAH1]|uniref:hypothetical protein n=1 Tax=unclassified Nannocystis TaxID=2627009 RepID=UPI00226FFFD7|nr:MULTISPECIES: hypothetical protein [unclassified Nannocystis]MCY0986522.1 hypothetical protein [Nannocystis sp. ILAH1]MCY0989193.1 hypothetical protein [Nannocystis sp. ILAH1]MCY1071397.1 hypothetical protein [Nannocystis sp. RBIL2]
MFGKIRRRYRLAAAEERMTVAEGELTVAMAELVVTERAEKQIVGERLRNAMAELMAARDGLSRLMR